MLCETTTLCYILDGCHFFYFKPVCSALEIHTCLIKSRNPKDGLILEVFEFAFIYLKYMGIGFFGFRGLHPVCMLTADWLLNDHHNNCNIQTTSDFNLDHRC